MGFFALWYKNFQKTTHFCTQKRPIFTPSHPKTKTTYPFSTYFLRPILHIKTTYFIFDLLCKKRPTRIWAGYVEFDQQDRVGQESGYPPAYQLLSIAVLRAFLYIDIFLYRFIIIKAYIVKIG